MDRRDLDPFDHGMLDVGDGHSIYWESWGDPVGIPVVFLHGGPGSGISPGHREIFDPDRYRVTFFDQRGCGRSRPLAREPEADLSSNTTQHLISDIEGLRAQAGIECWAVLGTSWGTTLGLAYAEHHPDRVTGVVLALVGLTTKREVQWITEGVGRIFAPEWEHFSSFPPEELSELPLVDAYARLLFDDDPSVRAEAAYEWCRWEDTHMGLISRSGPDLQLADPEFQLEFARLVTHYWSKGGFFAETELMDGASALNGIPGVLIHGRYDVSSPIETPWKLTQRWETAELVVVEDAGHGGGSMLSEMQRALESVTAESRLRATMDDAR